MEYEILFHVTPKKNLNSILDSGILPSMSQGKREVSWFATAPTLNWALAHISAKRNMPVSELIVFRVVVDKQFLTNTRWKGVYQSRFPVYPMVTVDLEHFLESPENGA